MDEQAAGGSSARGGRLRDLPGRDALPGVRRGRQSHLRCVGRPRLDAPAGRAPSEVGGVSTPIERAAAILQADLEAQLARSPREAAERAHCAGGPSIDELEQRIIARHRMGVISS